MTEELASKLQATVAAARRAIEAPRGALDARDDAELEAELERKERETR